MKKKFLSIVLIFMFLFSASCQKKQVVKIPPITPTKPQSSGYDWVETERKVEVSKYPINQSNHVVDPYKENWDTEKNRYASGRFYRDLNRDGIPELFLQYEKAEEANSFAVYQINETDYSYLCNLRFYSLEILTTMHNGYSDLLLFHKTGILRGGDKEGNLGLYTFVGNQYIEEKIRKYVIQEEAMSQKLFTPDFEINKELATITGKGNRDDDEKYRTKLLKDMFEVRIEINYKNEAQEEATVKYSGIKLSVDWSGLKIGRATQEQFDTLKKAGIAIYRRWEWVPVTKDLTEQSEQKQETVFVKDPYLDYWKIKENKNNFQWSLSRFYKDLNQDGVPELFFPRFGGSGGTTFSIYQIIKEGYLSLGSISYMRCQTLSTKHNGFNDLMLYWHMSADDGDFTIEEFNGTSYEAVKEMHVISEDTKNEKIFKPDKVGTWENHPDGDKLLWSSKDDDKYRRMIK
jgi:hypothetical protein